MGDQLPQLFDALSATGGADDACVERHLLSALRARAGRRHFHQALCAYELVADRVCAASESIWSLLLYCAVEAGSTDQCYRFDERLRARSTLRA